MKHIFACYKENLSDLVKDLNPNKIFTLKDATIYNRLSKVIRIKPDDSFILFDEAIHITIKADESTLAKNRVISGTITAKENNKPHKRPITFYLPILKKEALESAIYSAAAIGVQHIIPVITGVQSTDKQKTEVASTLALLFNNREFPLKIEKLEPIVTETGNKLLNISMTLHRIDIQPDKVVLSIIPQLTSTAKKNGVESQSLSTPNRESKASAPAQLPLSVFSGASPLNSG